MRAGDLDPRDGQGISEGYFAERSPIGGRVVVTWSNIGMSGFYAGPEVHIIDMVALAEPLLARLPAKEDPHTGAGHDGRISFGLCRRDEFIVGEGLTQFPRPRVPLLKPLTFDKSMFRKHTLTSQTTSRALGNETVPRQLAPPDGIPTDQVYPS